MGPPPPRAPIASTQLPCGAWARTATAHRWVTPLSRYGCTSGPREGDRHGFLSGTEGLGRVEEAEVEEGLAGTQHALIFLSFQIYLFGYVGS